MKEYWLQEAFRKSEKGLFHHQLQIPKSHKIPLTFLTKIVETPIGGVAHNPTNVGIPNITVTNLVKKRAVALLNADRTHK